MPNPATTMANVKRRVFCVNAAMPNMAMATLRQAMIVTESMGYPRLFAPFLIILTALFFMLAGMH